MLIDKRAFWMSAGILPTKFESHVKTLALETGIFAMDE